MTDHEARAREIADEVLQGKFYFPALVPAISQALREAEEAKDARISSLEETVAKAFLRCQALEEALKVFAAIKPSVHADGTEFKFYWVVIGTPDRVSFTNEDLRRARDVLCHASAERPPQSGDGETR